MRLSKTSCDLLKVRRDIREKIASILNVSDQTIKAYRRENKTDSDLTKKSVVELIATETGLSEEQILINESSNN